VSPAPRSPAIMATGPPARTPSAFAPTSHPSDPSEAPPGHRLTRPSPVNSTAIDAATPHRGQQPISSDSIESA
jgi:hypothetical protein